MWILLTVGFLSILGQVVLLRELGVASYGIELVYLLALGAWLLAGAVGAVVGRWPRQPSMPAVAALLGVFAVVLPASVVVLRAARLILTALPGAYLPLPQQALVLFVALTPASILLGVLFQWAARIYIAQGRTLAVAYGVESAGGLVGGLVATFSFRWGVQNFALAAGCGIVVLASAFLGPARRGSRIARSLLVVSALVAAYMLSMAPGLDRRMTAWSHPGLVDTRDTPYGRVTVARVDGQLSAFENDALWFDTESAAAETFAHIALLQHPHPDRVLLLGGGVEGVAAYAEQHAPRAIDYVELDEQMYRTVVRYLPDTTRRSMTTPSVRVIFTDPRLFVQQSGRYDVVLVAMPDPTSGSANRFYTREFFLACAGLLNPGGILGFRLLSSENFWTPLLTRRMVSVHRAVRSAFPYVEVMPGATNVWVASSNALPPDATILEERLNARHIRASLVSGPYLRYLYTNDRRAAIARTLEAGRAPVNSDVQPICYQYAALMWLGKFFPRLTALELPTGGAGSRAAGIVGLSVLALFSLSRIRGWWRDTLLVGVAGFVGMVLDGILILHFQMKNGIVFQDIGMLLTAFMAGLAAGALGFDRLATAGNHLRTIARWPGAALLGGLALVALIVGRVTDVGAGGRLLVVTVLLAVTGALVAALFAYVGLHRATDQARLVSPLYAADLVGGCAGSLVGSLCLIPMAGLALSARWMAALAALSLALL